MRLSIKKLGAFALSASMLLSLMACGAKTGQNGGDDVDKPKEPVQKAESEMSEVEKVIAEAEKLSNEELYKKAAEELQGKTMNGLGNSSRGATAATGFLEELKKQKSDFNGQIEWSQPKNNSIFNLLDADIKSNTHTYAMTLIQDGNQIQSKMLDTGLLLNYIPKDWKDAKGTNEEADGHPFTLQTLSKVFMFNNTGSKTFTNAWDFVRQGNRPLYMGVNSEPIGKNFLYMLTSEKYANLMKESFDKLPDADKAYFQKTIDQVAEEADELELEAENAKYGLAWVKLWCQQYNEQTDDGPICNELVKSSASDENGLLVYSKLRSVEESSEASVNNVQVAAYQDGYEGIGGYAYKHYLLIPKSSPLPWTACAFIAYMTGSQEGFNAWGKDMGGYCSNPNANQDHSKDGVVDGEVKFPNKNDRGYDWWMQNGKLVLEDPAYCSKTSVLMSDWVDSQLQK